MRFISIWALSISDNFVRKREEATMDTIEIYTNFHVNETGYGWSVIMLYGDYIKKRSGFQKADSSLDIPNLYPVIESLKALKKQDIPVVLFVKSNEIISNAATPTNDVERHPLWHHFYQLCRSQKNLYFAHLDNSEDPLYIEMSYDLAMDAAESKLNSLS